jgi:hypothetical protein
MEDKSKTFTWEWEDGETGEIRTIKLPMPDLDRNYDPSESHRDYSRSKATHGQRGNAGLDRDRPAEET